MTARNIGQVVGIAVAVTTLHKCSQCKSSPGIAKPPEPQETESDLKDIVCSLSRIVVQEQLSREMPQNSTEPGKFATLSN